MNPQASTNAASNPSLTNSRARMVGPIDLPRKAQARLAERIDLTRNKHKPLSILRAEAKRVLEQFLDQDPAASALTRPDRDRLIEDLIASSPGFGPLEELFRDESYKEILILNASQVIGRKNDSWLPTSARFRDDDQLRMVLQNWTNLGESYVPGGPSAGGYDLRLANGFRVLAVLPPAIMETAPQVLLLRGAPPVAPPQPVKSPAPNDSSTTPSPNAAGHSSTAPVASVGSGTGAMSGIYRPGTASIPRTSTERTQTYYNLPTPPSSTETQDSSDSGVISLGGSPTQRNNGANSTVSLAAPPASSASLSSASLTSGGSSKDPLIRLRQRVTHRIINKLAAAGVYDLNVIPLPELQKVILAQVVEYAEEERIPGDNSLHERLALEILAGMKR